MIKGNRGEWSELFVLLKLLGSRKISSAQYSPLTNLLETNPEIYFPLEKVFRSKEIINGKESSVEFNLLRDTDLVEIIIDGIKVTEVYSADFNAKADSLYKSITEGNGAFSIGFADELMKKICISKIKSSSTNKADIHLRIRDIFTGYSSDCGFSIKSELGSPPTLLNASKATNVVFKIEGLTDFQVEQINSINSRNKIHERMKRIFAESSVSFYKLANDTFKHNLELIDSRMDELLAHFLMISYKEGVTDCNKLVDLLADLNPMGFNREFYLYKVKKLLVSVALGMMPSKAWNGCEESNGGYLVVANKGNIYAFHLYNRDNFEEYLLKNTKLERASTTRHEYATLYREDNQLLLNLNLQIRFF